MLYKLWDVKYYDMLGSMQLPLKNFSKPQRKKDFFLFFLIQLHCYKYNIVMHACTLNIHIFLYYDIMYHAETYKSVIPTAIEISSFMQSENKVVNFLL